MQIQRLFKMLQQTPHESGGHCMMRTPCAAASCVALAGAHLLPASLLSTTQHC